MPLNGLLDIELCVPDPAELMGFWERRGMVQHDAATLGTADRRVQLRIAEGDYRHLSSLHLSCESEQDLADIARRLAELGVHSSVQSTTLTTRDPVHGHEVVIDVGAPVPLTPAQTLPWNLPGTAVRENERAAPVDTVALSVPPAPRRLGHIVLGSHRINDSTAFYFEGLGFRISDQIKKGSATFGRVERDHHNLLLLPAPTAYVNHYAIEVDGIDAVGLAARHVLTECSDSHIFGVGRHFLGSNVYWYLRDPSGAMFEFFCDMDQIVDDDAWARDSARYDWGGVDGPFPVSIWGPPTPPEFNVPSDIAHIAAAREALGLD